MFTAASFTTAETREHPKGPEGRVGKAAARPRERMSLGHKKGDVLPPATWTATEGAAPSDVSQTEEDTTTRPRSHAELKKHVAAAGCGHGKRPGGHESRGRPEPGDGVRRHDGQRQGGQSRGDAWRVTARRTLHPEPGAAGAWA